MIRITFSEPEIARLHYERFYHPDPRVRVKMEVLWLKSQGLSHHDITRLTRLSENTVRNYLRQYAQGGIETLKVRKVHRPQSALLRYRATLEAYFRQYPPASIKEAMAKIEELTGFKRGVTQVRQFLKAIGVYRETGELRSNPMFGG